MAKRCAGRAGPLGRHTVARRVSGGKRSALSPNPLPRARGSGRGGGGLLFPGRRSPGAPGSLCPGLPYGVPAALNRTADLVDPVIPSEISFRPGQNSLAIPATYYIFVIFSPPVERRGPLQTADCHCSGGWPLRGGLGIVDCRRQAAVRRSRLMAL